MTSLQGPSFTSLGLAWRRSSAVPSRCTASLRLVGGLAFTREPSGAAASSMDSARRLIAMRRYEPSMLMASGNGETCPLTVGLSSNRAWPPPRFFISRSASSVISNSLAIGCATRRSSPAVSNCRRKSRNESNAMREVYQTRRDKGNGNAGRDGQGGALPVSNVRSLGCRKPEPGRVGPKRGAGAPQNEGIHHKDVARPEREYLNKARVSCV